MSLYRFVRLTAVLALARRYRGRLLRLLFALAFALVTVWQYADIAQFIDQQAPNWAGPVLAFKTLIVYAALLLVFWELRAMLRGDSGSTADVPPEESLRPPPARGPLDELAERPRLRHRRNDILETAGRGSAERD